MLWNHQNKNFLDAQKYQKSLVGKVLDMSQTCQKVGQMSEIFDSDDEVFDTK